MIAEIVAKNIEKARIEKGMTQEEAGRVLGMSRATYNGLENGKRPVAVDELEKLGETFGIPVDRFFEQPRDVAKFEQMYLYILGHFKEGVPKVKLAKLLYLVDFSNYYDELESMSGVSYVKQKYGPVADVFFQITDELYDDGKIDVVPEEFMFRIRPVEGREEYGLLTEEDRGRIDKICEIWKDKRTAEIVDFTHRQKPWMACSSGEVIPYALIIQEEPDNVYAPGS